MAQENKNQKLIEYVVESSHTEDIIKHELVFSLNKLRFAKPAYSDGQKGKIVYKLLPGTYAKFKLFVTPAQNYAEFSIILFRINTSANVDEKKIFEVKSTYSEFLNIPNDPNAPRTLKHFIEMIPRYNSTAIVYPTNEHETEDFQNLVEEIKKYFKSERRSQ